MMGSMNPLVPIVLAVLIGWTVQIVGYSLGWSGGAIGTICLVIIAAAVLWRYELLPDRIFQDK
jgi:hypothetical protein